MKKPDITKGEWKIKEDNYGPYIGTQYDSICTVDTHNYDAQAISAVPDMIDALIKADRLLRLNLPETNSARQKIRKALEKAGVEL